MADVKWVKLTTDMFDNRKIRHLRRLPEGNNIVLIWVMLLTMAGRCNSGGMIFLTENIPYTPKMLADELGFEENTVLLALNALEQLDMIVTDNGIFTIAGWEEYQNADKLAEIRAKDRERKRLKRAQAKALLTESTDVHGMSTDCPHIEEEREEEKEKEEESHSFNHSAREEAKMRFLGGTLGKGVVMLSDEQMEDLLEVLSLDEFNKYVAVVADMELSGKHYKKKTHYQAILDMANKDRRVNKRKETNDEGEYAEDF
jgi:predicted phage replisome organizer